MPDDTKTEFCWLVELFEGDGTRNSAGWYHTGFLDITGYSRTTRNPHEARRYTREQAERMAANLGTVLNGTWRAVEHGFATASSDEDLERRTGEPHIDGWPLRSCIPPAAQPAFMQQIDAAKESVKQLPQWMQDAAVTAAASLPNAAAQPAMPEPVAHEFSDVPECPKCGGSGETIVMSNNGPDAEELTVDCQHCEGRGTLEAAYEGVLKLLRAQEQANLKHAAEAWGLQFSSEFRAKFIAKLNDCLRDKYITESEAAARCAQMVEALRVGSRLANIAFNWSQSANSVGSRLSEQDREMLKTLQQQWDAALAAAKEQPR